MILSPFAFKTGGWRSPLSYYAVEQTIPPPPHHCSSSTAAARSVGSHRRRAMARLSHSVLSPPLSDRPPRAIPSGEIAAFSCKPRRLRPRDGTARRSWSAVSSKVPALSFSCSGDCRSLRSQHRQRGGLSKAANLDDIISERGACGVGFIANLQNEASHKIIKDALVALDCMEHRGGCGADNDSGDGAGIMTSIPWDLYNNWASKQGLSSFDRSNTGVGMIFLPKDEKNMMKAKKVIVKTFLEEGLEVLSWRPVPIDASIVGFNARETMPNIHQVFVKLAKNDNAEDIERKLYVCRKLIERAANLETWNTELYFCSLSNQTVVYKGMLRSEALGKFYLDLHSNLYKSAFAIYHRRYSTNTSPRWSLAQPLRLLGHNGEINTIQGNLNWMQSRETTFKSPVWHDREGEICPFGNSKASDSANLDSAVEVNGSTFDLD